MYDIWDRSDRFRYKEANGQCAVVSPCVCTGSSHKGAWISTADNKVPYLWFWNYHEDSFFLDPKCNFEPDKGK